MKTVENREQWHSNVTVYGKSGYIFERADRNNGLFIKYPHPTRKGRDTRQLRKLPGDLTVRDSKGRVDDRFVKEVKLVAERFLRDQFDGKSSVAEKAAESLTLKRGFELALALPNGKYVTRSERWEEVERAKRKLIRILGPDKLWTDIRPSDVRGVWRQLAAEYRDSDGSRVPCGVRQTVVTLSALFAIAVWLRQEQHIPAGACMPVGHWQKHLKDEWERITGKAVRVNRPAHTAQEFRQLTASLNSPEVDPRLAILFLCGAEQRVGQFRKAVRTQLRLPEVPELPTEDTDFGGLAVQGRGKKNANPILLTDVERAAFDEALATGFLCDYEMRFRSGEVADYPLFPAGRLAKGRAKVVPGAKCLGKTGVLKMFKNLERVAGVKSIPGRGFYGAKRAAADMAEDVMKDERVLNNVTGHAHTSTRRLYQNGLATSIQRAAAKVRRQIRAQVPGSPTSVG